MKRKTFIEKSFLASLGLVLTPSLLLSCREDDLLPDSDFKGKVIIIGAGAAGLYAGYILQSRGIDFTILEASDRIGGRLSKKTDFADYPVDLGAQWLHGKNSILGDLIESTNTKITEDNSDRVFWYNNTISNSIPQDVEDIVTPASNLPDISFADYASQQGLGNDYKDIVEQLAGDFGADSSDISIKWTATEEEDWNSGETDYKFEESFFDVLDRHIVSKIKDSILVNKPVSKIDYSAESIGVTITTPQTTELITGDKVIVAVPIPILKDNDIQFVPALPTEKTDAFSKIGMGAGMKVFLKFSEKFYDENIIGGSVCAAYADESIGKSGNDHVLLAFVMGQQAERLTALGSDAAITTALLTELDAMYSNKATASFLSSHVEDYSTKPYIKGAYSYSKVGIGTARTTAAQSVDNKLFFAGEAMNLNGHHQTVHGAMETGYREVINLLKS